MRRLREFDSHFEFELVGVLQVPEIKGFSGIRRRNVLQSLSLTC